MLAFLAINQSDKKNSGLLVIDPLTQQPLYLGTSPLSKLLLRGYIKGFTFPQEDVVRRMVVRNCAPKTIAHFRELAPIYYGYGKIEVRVFENFVSNSEMTYPLPFEDLTISYTHVTNEDLQNV